MPVFVEEISSPGEIDSFEFDLVAGEDYYLAVLGTSSGGGSLPDPVVDLIDPSGTSLGMVNDSEGWGFDVFEPIEVATSGTYTVAVSGYDDETGDYMVVIDQAGSPLWEDLGLVA